MACAVGVTAFCGHRVDDTARHLDRAAAAVVVPLRFSEMESHSAGWVTLGSCQGSLLMAASSRAAAAPNPRSCMASCDWTAGRLHAATTGLP